jgi:hypothetical protein
MFQNRVRSQECYSYAFEGNCLADRLELEHKIQRLLAKIDAAIEKKTKWGS